MNRKITVIRQYSPSVEAMITALTTLLRAAGTRPTGSTQDHSDENGRRQNDKDELTDSFRGK